MKNLYLKLSLNVIAVFMVVIVMSFLPELFPKFFGDWLCEGHLKDDVGCLYSGNTAWSSHHNPEWHWGYQHHLWFLMGLILFVIQGFRIYELITKHKSEES